MKTIEVDEALYRYIASHTQHIGESASEILRRMLNFTSESHINNVDAMQNEPKIGTALNSSFTIEDVSEHLEKMFNSTQILLQTKAVDRFIQLLSVLYSLNPNAFAEATQSLHGRTRIYFAKDEQTLLQHGAQTKPKVIHDTPYWVITNTNSARKRNMVTQIMQSMRFSNELIKQACDVI